MPPEDLLLPVERQTLALSAALLIQQFFEQATHAFGADAAPFPSVEWATLEARLSIQRNSGDSRNLCR